MARISRILLFVGRSATVGLAAAFVVVLLRPDLAGFEQPTALNATSFADAVAASSPAVANVFAERTTGRGSLGSAVVMDSQGYLVTNWHVVRDAAQIRVQLADGRVATPELVGADPDTEVALLKIDLPNLPSIRTSRSDNLRVGQIVLAIGNSLGLSQTVTMGIVSATGRGQLGVTTFEDFIQTDAAINVGNSGGALVNTSGELVGINTAVFTRVARGQTPPEGIGFAIPVNLVRGVMAELIRHGRVIRGYLGVLESLEHAVIPANVGSELDGPVIELAAIEGPALDAGMAAGDFLTHLNGQRIVSRQQLLSLIARSQPGTEVRLRGIRPGSGPFEVVVTLADRAGAPGS